MYTKKPSEGEEDLYDIVDPTGDIIASALGEGVVDTLLSHLNR